MSIKEYRLGYRADIEGLRAIAILLVVAVHAGVPWLSGGFVGVDVFFVLSGFLITGLLVQEVKRTGRLHFVDFYIRRLRRLLPALIVMLLVTGEVATLLLAPAEQRDQASAGAMAAFWLSNIHFAFASLDYFAPGTETNLFLHTWSLGVEEQFYLLWPTLLVWLLGRDGDKGVARLKVGMFTVVAISLTACMVLTYKAPQLAFYMMPLRAWQFSAGALVWLYFKRSKKLESGRELIGASENLNRLTGWLGFAMILAAAVVFDSKISYPGWRAVIPTLGTVLILIAGSYGSLYSVSALLSWQPLQSIGRISYSWYLWHWPLLLLGHALTGSNSAIYRFSWVMLSLALAVFSYRYIEAPIRHRSWRLLRGKATLLYAVALMILVNVFCIRWYNQASLQMERPEQHRYALAHADAPVIYGMGCDDWYHSDQVRMCTFGSKAAVHTAVLFGDSIAGQWFPAVATVFDKLGWKLIVLTKSSCPMVGMSFFYERIGRDYTECSTWRASALKQIAAMKPDVVLMSSVSTSKFSQSQWVQGSESVLRSIAPSTGHIYIFRGTPNLPFDGPDCLAAKSLRPGWFPFKDACSASSADQHADDVYQWLELASSQFDNVTTLDMDRFICPDGKCSAERNGVIVFRDSQHISATFAESLAPALEAQLKL